MKLVSIPLTLVLVIAGLLGLRSIGDLKKTIQTEAQRETEAEVNRMQGEIRKRLTDQFQTPAVQKTVREAATEATKTAAEPLIKNEVGTQVKLRVDAERPAIGRTVTQQTQAAVKQMEPQIDSLVKDSVDAKVQKQVQPVVQSLQDLKADSDLQRLIIRMNSDDALAFDEVFSRLNQSSDPKQRDFLGSMINDVVESHENATRFALRFTAPHTEEQGLAELKNPARSMRLAALDNYGTSPKLSLSTLVELASSDSSLNVRCLAAKEFDRRTKQQFPCLAKQIFPLWWEANKQKPEYQQK